MSQVPLQVWRVGRNANSQHEYVLVLRDDLGRLLPMMIGPCEAVAIWSGLQAQGEERGPRRPITHDLLTALIDHLGGRLTKVVIDDLWNGVYYAKLHLAVDGKTVTVDARPSDGVAVSLRAGVPLYGTDAVLAAAAQPEEPS